MSKRPYRCPGCDREAHVSVMRTTMHNYGDGGLVYSITCGRDEDRIARGGVNDCLGEWFRLRAFTCETNAVSEWNDAIIEMGAAAVGITPKQARALKEGRLSLVEKDSTP